MGIQSTIREKLALARREEQFFLKTEYSKSEGKKLKILIEIMEVLTESPYTLGQRACHGVLKEIWEGAEKRKHSIRS